MTYPGTPGSKIGGTSEEAAISMSDRAVSLRQQVVELLTKANLTTDEAAEILGCTVLAIRPRFSELRTMGIIESTGERRPNKSGKSANVWYLITRPTPSQVEDDFEDDITGQRWADG